MGRTRDHWRERLGVALALMVGGTALMVPLGARLVGPTCASELCLPIGIIQRTGIFGHPIHEASVTAGVLAVLVGAVLVARIAWQRHSAQG